MTNTKRVLMIAYHFPPVRVSSGIQRTLKFCTYLQEYGWDPLVLTISPRAYESINPDQMKEIPPGVVVERAFGLDTSRHLAIRGKYLKHMALPDRWISWWPGAVRTGMKMIKEYKPDAIFSTYPITTAHLIGMSLSKRSGLPWIADCRDSMSEEAYPRDPLTWKIQRRIEMAMVDQCTRAIFTTQPTRDMYRDRYPDSPETKWAVIENGYDEENFLQAESGLERTPLGKPGQISLVHSGILYPQERDPLPFFAALNRLKLDGTIGADSLQIILRATGNDDFYRSKIVELNLQDIIRLEPVIAYREALQEMLRADGLLLFQGDSCDHQIPAKIYEYYRSGKPIFSLVGLNGITATMLRSARAEDMADISNASNITTALSVFIENIKNGAASGVDAEFTKLNSRKSRTRELANLLDTAITQD